MELVAMDIHPDLGNCGLQGKDWTPDDGNRLRIDLFLKLQAYPNDARRQLFAPRPDHKEIIIIYDDSESGLEEQSEAATSSLPQLETPPVRSEASSKRGKRPQANRKH